MVGNTFYDEVVDHVTGSTLKNVSRFKVESRKIFGMCPFCVSC